MTEKLKPENTVAHHNNNNSLSSLAKQVEQAVLPFSLTIDLLPGLRRPRPTFFRKIKING